RGQRGVQQAGAMQSRGPAQLAMIGIFAPEVWPGSVPVTQRGFDAEPWDIHLLGGLCQDDVGGYEHAARPQHPLYLAKEGATGREVKHGFDTRDAVKAAGGERQLTGIGPYPAQRVVVQRFELSTEGELTRVDVDTHEPHAPKTLIEVLQRR